MAPPCKAIELDITGRKVEDAVQDTALAAMVGDGWTIGAFWIVERENVETTERRQSLMLLMVPPPREPVIAVSPSGWTHHIPLAVAMTLAVVVVLAVQWLT